MALDLGTLDATRYLTDATRMVVEFLDYYLNLDHVALWVNVGETVDVYARDPSIPPRKVLTQPEVTVADASDRVVATILNSATKQHYGEHHEISWEITCSTDGDTGGRVTVTDLAGAVQKCFADHESDMVNAGIAIIDRIGARDETDPESGLSRKVCVVRTDVTVFGEAVQTLELELGRFTFSGEGTGTFADGEELDLDHTLRLKCITGISLNPINATVTAKNLAGGSGTLTGIIPGATTVGTYVALTPSVPGAQFCDVTNIAVGIGSGKTGEIFAVVNIPEDL